MIFSTLSRKKKSGERSKKIYSPCDFSFYFHFFVELFGGFQSGSIALLADAGHIITDTIALSLSLIAVLLSSKNRIIDFHLAIIELKF